MGVRAVLLTVAAFYFLVVGPGDVCASEPEPDADQPFEAGVIDMEEDVGPILQRYYTPASSLVSPLGPNNCTGNLLWRPPFCELAWKPVAQGYRGYLENTSGFGGANGTRYYALFDYLVGAGTFEQKGYYACTSNQVYVGDTGKWSDRNCEGVVNVSCLGPASEDNAGGSAELYSAIGPVYPIGGLRPIPVPHVDEHDGDVVYLSWKAADCVGSDEPLRYEIHTAVDRDPEIWNRFDCFDKIPDPGTFFGPIETTTNTRTTVLLEDSGLYPGESACVFYQIRLRYPDADGTRIVTEYGSASSRGLVSESYCMPGESDHDGDFWDSCEDCDDLDPDVVPGAPQICDGKNNDCYHPGWPRLENTNEYDDDGDGSSECAGDCDDGDPAVWSAPDEVRWVDFVDHETLAWSDPLYPGADAIVFDVIRAEDPADFDAGCVCVESDDGDREAVDPDAPLPAAAFFYLVRAENGCPEGEGALGRASGGAERSACSCP